MSWVDFLRGALTLAALVVALFFLRFWRETHDRLFLIFSLAFVLLASTWLLSVGHGVVEHAHFLRFAAFVLIAYAVIDKNRRGS